METLELYGRRCHILRSGEAKAHFYWPVMPDEDLKPMEEALLGTGKPFLMTAFEVESWNDDLSPWPAGPVFGDRGFAGKADETLAWLKAAAEKETLPRYVGGYSLGGLFAVLCLYETNLFAGAVSGSGSFWYPGWAEYAASKAVPSCEKVLFSLGDREERSRNPDFARVGDTTRDLMRRLDEAGVYTELRMDRGGHFDHPEKRMAENFARLLTLI